MHRRVNGARNVHICASHILTGIEPTSVHSTSSRIVATLPDSAAKRAHSHEPRPLPGIASAIPVSIAAEPFLARSVCR